MKYLILILPIILLSCRPIKTVIQTEYRDSIVYSMKFDSIYFSVKDSVYIKEKNDTVLIEKWKTIFKDKIMLRTDTVTLTNTLTNVQHIEKKQSGFNVFLKYSGMIFWMFLILFILYRLTKRF